MLNKYRFVFLIIQCLIERVRKHTPLYNIGFSKRTAVTCCGSSITDGVSCKTKHYSSHRCGTSHNGSSSCKHGRSRSQNLGCRHSSSQNVAVVLYMPVGIPIISITVVVARMVVAVDVYAVEP